MVLWNQAWWLAPLAKVWHIKKSILSFVNNGLSGSHCIKVRQLVNFNKWEPSGKKYSWFSFLGHMILRCSSSTWNEYLLKDYLRCQTQFSNTIYTLKMNSIRYFWSNRWSRLHYRKWVAHLNKDNLSLTQHVPFPAKTNTRWIKHWRKSTGELLLYTGVVKPSWDLIRREDSSLLQKEQRHISIFIPPFKFGIDILRLPGSSVL